MLLYGYRGSGKTSALRKIQSLVREALPKSVIVEVPLRVPSSEAMLIQGIAEVIREQLEKQTRMSGRVKRAFESLSSLSVAGTGFERKVTPRPAPSSLLAVWRAALSALAESPLLCVCVDDAELLNAGEIGILKTIIETDSPVPVMIVVAGGPELIEKLSQREASPILRAFSGAVFDIGQFTQAETRDALEAPIRSVKATGRWDASGVSAVFHLTHGYPYLVQCFAAGAYVDGGRIREQDVKDAIPTALRLASSWLERELPEASDEDIRAFAKIAALGQVEFRNADVLRLGINSIYLSRLTRVGVLKRLSRGRYELRMAPAVAYFHALRRKITL